jgi:Trk K+ transport system NAD-binding subunit
VIEGISVATGEIDDQQTYRNMRVEQARMVVATRDDVMNTNIAMTIREVAPEVPIAAVAGDENALDILELAGVTDVLPLRRWLGEQLANRVTAQHLGLQTLGSYGDLEGAELPVRHTNLSGHTIRETRLRERFGVNIYLASYCRNLNPDMRIVSRITHERNIDAMYRAGADFVLSYATLGVDAIMSALRGKQFMVLGEGVDLFARSVPESLYGETLTESRIGAMTGMTVVAVKEGEETITKFPPELELGPDMELLLIGSDEQLETFIDRYA